MSVRGWMTVALCLLAAFPGAARAANFDQFGFESATAELSTQEAGAHPDFTTDLVFKQDPSVPGYLPYAALSDVSVDLPPGLLGNLNAVEECPLVKLAAINGEGCPLSAQVGVARALLGGEKAVSYRSSIFRVAPSGDGVVARFGFFINQAVTFINVRIRSDADYGASADVSGIQSVSNILEVETTLWGVPGASSHDKQRFLRNEEDLVETPPRPSGIPPKPFLSNPTSCSGPLDVAFRADSYQERGKFVEAKAPLGEITGCDEVPFAPELSIVPTDHSAGAASGAEATLSIPYDESTAGKASSSLHDAVIKLPEGLSVAAGQADGLAACSASEVGYGMSPSVASHCPDASKIASAEIDSPSLPRPLEGAVYLRTPEPGHLTRAWLITDDQGLHVKIPGEFQLDPKSGQITSLFLQTPQVPVRRITLRFPGGPRAALATPRKCGTYETQFDLTPWSGGPHAIGQSPMSFDANCDAGGFKPSLLAGATNPVAAQFSSLMVRLTQASGEENLARLSVTMPPGVLAKLKGVPLCPEAMAPSGQCPASSLLGRATAAVGPGPGPLWIPQPGKDPTAIYLAGPYKTAPYSLIVDTPAQAGPFDLGDVVVRVALQIDPSTAQVIALSDPLPQILEGVPVSYRDVDVSIDRPEFGLNPTSCDVMAATGTASGAAGSSASLSSRFQVRGCQKLRFGPKLTLKLGGGTKRGDYESLKAVVRPGGGPAFANIGAASVTLPHSAFLAQNHIRTVCTRVQFAADACPKGSIYGRAEAISALLDYPLEGNVYLRSSNNPLPDLVAKLDGPEGEPIEIDLSGRTDSHKGALRNSFDAVPDAPVKEFTLELFGGKRGLIQLSSNHFCAPKNRRADVVFTGQNGKSFKARPLLRHPGCAKRKQSTKQASAKN
jgi:hypothetical protein